MLGFATLLPRIEFRVATAADRARIYAMRHEVYARELGEHAVNPEGHLTDRLDRVNEYLVAAEESGVAGFVSVTPPWAQAYAVEEYLSRDECPVEFDAGLFEVRILTVADPYRGGPLAGLLMWAALRWVQSRGGRRLLAMVRSEITGLYEKVGLRKLGREVRAGAVTLELMSATVKEVQEAAERVYLAPLRKMAPRVCWRIGVPLFPSAECEHGGRSIEALGRRLEWIDRRGDVIAADVLDAWFSPPPEVLQALRDGLDWIVRTSPPAFPAGLVEKISEARGVPAACVVPGAGSSDLIDRAFRGWLGPSSRALVADPAHGEYAHVLGGVLRCGVDRFFLEKSRGYRLDVERLREGIRKAYDLVVLMNPNNSTGRLIERAEMEDLLREAPAQTRFWIDETYLEYAGARHSLEQLAAASRNVFVCKSMSKVYALSGLRVGYLVAPETEAAQLLRATPPRVLGLAAQVAALRALDCPAYYEARWGETRALRVKLARALRALPGVEVFEGSANFLLLHLDPRGCDAPALADRSSARGLYVRDLSPVSATFAGRAVRVTVMDAETNARTVSILAAALGGEGSGGAA